MISSRTPPGVRELKQIDISEVVTTARRTPPGVRELKLETGITAGTSLIVAPLPGCVN